MKRRKASADGCAAIKIAIIYLFKLRYFLQLCMIIPRLPSNWLVILILFVYYYYYLKLKFTATEIISLRATATRVGIKNELALDPTNIVPRP